MDHHHVRRYLDRLGVTDLPGGLPDRAPSDDADAAAALAVLQRRHLLSVPFENLDIHLGRPIALTEDGVFGKVVDRRRGGFCFELNGIFAMLLRGLGYRVDLLAARVVRDDGTLGIPYDHLALRVQADGPRLADVGFGRFALAPLDLADRGEQHDAQGVFRIQDAPDGDLDVYADGKPAYRLETRPRAWSDFAAGSWWHQTSPESHFTQAPVCTLLTDEGRGRITLSGRTLIVTDAEGRREEKFPDDEALLKAYRDHFGFDLEKAPSPLRGDA
ncbi:arylamine N-acetyltransferase family protein [Yinghuangia soli]|uniref:Arylamine N-acetyltransferase n=1 Tax=Yinghuangia soli TaxID=2908204 RepID=A0AA41U5Z5_9ACTN|nr:arylamine N-acetyltransferase [Yinghuangia soli]MCF2532412.1 arylamine N-acetyltransferase [Yinghuangia soli]